MNKSFIYGICFASITWVISLYLYFQLSNTENSSQRPLEYAFQTQEQTFSNRVDDKKTEHNKISQNYINKPDLLKKLKPIQRNSEKIDDGKYI